MKSRKGLGAEPWTKQLGKFCLRHQETRTWVALFDSLGHHQKTKCWPQNAQKRESVGMVEILQGIALIGGLRALM